MEQITLESTDGGCITIHHNAPRPDPIVGLDEDAIDGYAVLYRAARRFGRIRPGISFENFLRTALMFDGRRQ